MKDKTKTVTPPVVADATTPAKTPAAPRVLSLTEKGKAHVFKPGSQRAVWFATVVAADGKPVAEWLAQVAKDLPAQRAKENAKTPHKSGHGFLGRFKELGLVTEVEATPEA
jgi:hypothetical protein